MSVPEHIRKVPRPVNTVVIANKSDGPHQYAVRERKKPIYRKGKTPSPRNGAVIGYIYEGKYVPLIDALFDSQPQIQSFGPSALIKSVCQDVFEDLTQCYALGDACFIMTMACLRIIRPHVPNCRMASLYQRHFISQYYPGMTLSKNTIGKYLNLLGMNFAKQRLFYQKRLSRVAVSDHIAIDGMLKTDSSKVNDLSAFSRKARIRGTQDISVLFAYDIEKKEPICAEVFPGNTVDASAYRAFIRDNKITKGIIVADKGFPPNNILTELRQNKELHFITPIKRNDKRIQEHELTKFEAVLNGVEDPVLYCKKEVKGRFLYAFRDARIAGKEESGFVMKSGTKHNFDASEYETQKDRFGLIVIESDQNLDPATVYKCYEDRWMLEVVFDRYKNAIELNQTNVQGDFSVYGNEFINFIATLLTMRIIRKADEAKLLEDMTYYDLMDDLSSAWRTVEANHESPKFDDDAWVHTTKKVMELMIKLDLVQGPPQTPKGKPGRPKTRPEFVGPKRPRGRPRKNV